MPTYRHHHVSINTSSLEAAIGFYKLLGFTEKYRYTDDTVTIVHLLGGGGFIELFCYANSALPRFRKSDAPHSKRIGFDHFSLQVADIHAAYEDLKEFALGGITAGRTKIDYFFILDPDGNRIEIVKDVRAFVPDTNEG